MSMNQHVLIVEDEEFVLALMGAYLRDAGFKISLAANGREMLALLDKEKINLILLDLGLPDEDGLVLTRQIRARSSVPIIVLTGRTGQDDRLAALELGADDYLTKPCDPREIVLRVQNLLDRAGGGPKQPGTSEEIIRFDKWALDLASHMVIGPNGEDVTLTPAEFNLLTCFVRAPNRVLTRDHLLDAVSRYDDSPNDRMIDVLVSRLRKKIEDDPRKPAFIVTIRGCGYKFSNNPS
ncbi:MAG: response regulator transcription factor [Proteobacteria bacterium]|nr:response regulator transcription factor [Pseudomonadota bacterium]